MLKRQEQFEMVENYDTLTVDICLTRKLCSIVVEVPATVF